MHVSDNDHLHFCWLCDIHAESGTRWCCPECSYDEEERLEYVLPCYRHHPLWDRWGDDSEGNVGHLDNSGPGIATVFNALHPQLSEETT